jgi:hypothetical protein
MSTRFAIGSGRLAAGALTGLVCGSALGVMNWWFLSCRIDFSRPKNFSDLPGEYVGCLLIGLNLCCGLVAGVAVVAFPNRDSLLERVLPSGVIGGYLGALIGLLDVAVLARFLNLLDSDLVGVWRENRSLLVILNAAATAGLSVLTILITDKFYRSRAIH